MAYKTIVEDNIDILVAGAGLGGCGAAFEARFWGQDKKIVVAERLISIDLEQLLKDFMQLTATWELDGVRIIQRIMWNMRVLT